MGKILVADDTEASRYALEKALSSAGYEVITAEDGGKALQLFKKESPDLVITDVKMPAMDGFELAEKIRQINGQMHMPVIFISAAYKDMDSKIKALDMGENDFLAQPVNDDELNARVRSLLKTKVLYESLDDSRNKLKEINNALEERMNERSQELKILSETLEQRVLDRAIELGVANKALDYVSEGRLQAINALQESEEKFRTLAATAKDAIIMINSDNCVSCWNRAAEEMLGFSSAEVIGGRIHETIIPERFREDYLKGFKVFKDTGQGTAIGQTVELVALRKDGTEFPIGLSLSAVQLEGKWNAVGIMRDITDRKKAEEQIESSLKEKEILLAEIHHRVKNNLQVIASMLHLQSGLTKDNNLVEILDDNQSRIHSMALVHETLYQTRDFTKITSQDYISELAGSLINSYREKTATVTIKVEAVGIMLNIDTIIPIGLIINELITNSMKYAFQERRGNEIKVAIKDTGAEGELELIVSDNGVGISEDIDFEKTKTLGLRLIRILAEDQLSGKVEINRGKGTEFRITFKQVKRDD